MMAQVACRSGISQSQLLRMESGLSGVTSQRLIDLAAIYDVSPNNLLDSQLVYAKSSSDLDRLGLVIEFVEAALINCSPQLESSAIRRAIIWIFQQERAALLAQSKTFDVTA